MQNLFLISDYEKNGKCCWLYLMVRKKENYVDKIQQKHKYIYKNLDFMGLLQVLV